MKMLNEKITFLSGHQMKNRFMLAPLTNTQSHEDGVLSDDEYYWLTKRAQGGFGITMSCASHVQDVGKGFPGQLGIFDDKHIKGLTKLTTEIKEHDSLAIAQLHHAGMRSPEELIDTQPVCPSDATNTGARALNLTKLYSLVMILFLQPLELKNLAIKASKYMEPMVIYFLSSYLQKLIDEWMIMVAQSKIDQELFLRLLMELEMSVAKILF